MKNNICFSTEGLSVGYNGRALISDISLNLQKGEILTLIGPNGSGKSTILKSITRHLALIVGTVYIDSKNMRTMNGRDVATRMAVVLTERVRPELMTCVKGDCIAAYGAPDEIFSDERVRALYEIECGSYNALIGSVELSKPTGDAKAFLIGGAGCGVRYYRALQKANIPFTAGILWENDVDYAIASVVCACRGGCCGEAVLFRDGGRYRKGKTTD